MHTTRKQIAFLAMAFTAAIALPAQAQLFGPSDEEIAAEQAREDAQNSKIENQANQINALNTRVRDLEESLRQATGRNEALDNRMNQLTQQMERQQRDFDYRLCTMTARQLGAGTDPASGGINCAAASAPAAAPQENVRLPGGAIPLAPPPGSLGTLSMGGGGQRSYDQATNLLARNQLNEASAAFRAFADNNPDDPLAPQAVQWVGRIAFNQNDYATAARTFAELIKKYPKSTVGPDSMVRLGQSLIAMGQKNEGCTALSATAIKKQFPSASTAVLDQAAIERRNAACK
jgi:tol-pal system protein YbgF